MGGGGGKEERRVSKCNGKESREGERERRTSSINGKTLNTGGTTWITEPESNRTSGWSIASTSNDSTGCGPTIGSSLTPTDGSSASRSICGENSFHVVCLVSRPERSGQIKSLCVGGDIQIIMRGRTGEREIFK